MGAQQEKPPAVSQRKKLTGFEDKTLWDWLDLLAKLAIPIVVLGATIGFGWWQVHLADLQHQSDQKLAQQQHDTDKQSTLDQQEATTLQTYIDNIQDLLLNHNLLKSKPFDAVAILARARTLAALQGLDPERKGRLLRFLYEAKLIGFADTNDKENASIINLFGAILSQADLSGANLSGADLEGAILSGANLSRAHLEGAYLNYTNLNGADLNRAILSHADLFGADLSGANLSRDFLLGADLRGANLKDATGVTAEELEKQAKSLEGATMPDGSKHP